MQSNVIDKASLEFQFCEHPKEGAIRSLQEKGAHLGNEQRQWACQAIGFNSWHSLPPLPTHQSARWLSFLF